MTEKKKKKTNRMRIKPVRKHIFWSHGGAIITIPAGMRDSMGIRPMASTEVEVSLFLTTNRAY